MSLEVISLLDIEGRFQKLSNRKHDKWKHRIFRVRNGILTIYRIRPKPFKNHIHSEINLANGSIKHVTRESKIIKALPPKAMQNQLKLVQITSNTQEHLLVGFDTLEDISECQARLLANARFSIRCGGKLKVKWKDKQKKWLPMLGVLNGVMLYFYKEDGSSLKKRYCVLGGEIQRLAPSLMADELFCVEFITSTFQRIKLKARCAEEAELWYSALASATKDHIRPEVSKEQVKDFIDSYKKQFLAEAASRATGSGPPSSKPMNVESKEEGPQ